MAQEVYSLTAQASASATATAPVVGWISVVNGSGDACQTALTADLQFSYGFGHAEGRGSTIGHGTGCGADEVDDRGKGYGWGNACDEETQF